MRALQDSRSLQETIADLLRKGLAAPSRPTRVQFPLIQCAHAATAGTEITPERVAEILLEQELP